MKNRVSAQLRDRAPTPGSSEIVLVLRPEPAGPDRFCRDPSYRLKVLLKRTLRPHGFRCIAILPADAVISPPVCNAAARNDIETTSNTSAPSTRQNRNGAPPVGLDRRCKSPVDTKRRNLALSRLTIDQTNRNLE